MTDAAKRVRERGASGDASGDASYGKRAGGYAGRAGGYVERSVLKPPVWTWEVPVYFFTGGLSGMAAVLAFASKLSGAGAELSRTAILLAAGGALVSAGLLIRDLGRPQRFLYMLRVVKLRSPMSVGAWALALFGGFASFAAALLWTPEVFAGFAPMALVRAATWTSLAAAAVFGAVLATYTGVLIGATVIPAWNTHRIVLPVHFGTAGLGSAAAVLELLGVAHGALVALGIGAAAVETLLALYVELAARNNARVWRGEESGPREFLRASGVLTGPASLLLRITGSHHLAASSFLAGALLSRFAWLAVGRASAGEGAAAHAERGRRPAGRP